MSYSRCAWSYNRCASLVFALVVSACASSGGTSSGEEGQTAERGARGTSTLIIRAELERSTSPDLWEAVNLLRPRWLQLQRGASFSAPQQYAQVVINGTPSGQLDELRQLFPENVDTLRYLSAADATTRYGTGYPGGVIEVSTLQLGR